MTKDKKGGVKGYLALFVIFVVIPFGALAVLWKDRCKESRIAEIPSSVDGLVAALITTDCGTSMKIATEVRLERRGPGDAKTSEVVLLVAGTPTLPVVWSDGVTGPLVTIDVPEGIDVVKYRRAFGDVAVVANIPPRPAGQTSGKP